MARNKTQLLVRPVDKPTRGRSTLLQRTAANAKSNLTDRRSTAVQRVNQSSESVVAIVLRNSQPLSAAELELVPAGAAVMPDAECAVVAFIDEQGMGYRFTASGTTRLSRAQTAQEFPGAAARATRMLKSQSASIATGRAGVQRVADANASASAIAVDHALARSSSQPLPPKQLRRLESAYGARLDSVRVHTDTAADQAARSVQSHAFTTGQDIYFRAGQYDPQTAAGQHLLAHEVAHTVQQQAGPAHIAAMSDSPSNLGAYQVSEPHQALEIEADVAATRALQGHTTRISKLAPQQGSPSLTGPLLARRTADPAPSVTPLPGAAPTQTKPVGDSTTIRAQGPATDSPKADAAEKHSTAPSKPTAPAVNEKGSPESATAKSDSPATAKGQNESPGQGEKNVGANKQGDPSARSDAAGLQSVLTALSEEATTQKDHPSAESKQQETVQAVNMTPEEADGKAKAEKGKQLTTAQKLVFNKEAFKSALRAKIQALKADEAKQIKEGDQAQAIVNVAKSGAEEGKQSAAADITQKTAQPAPTITPIQGTPLPAVDLGPKPQVDATRAVPPPVEEAKVSLASEGQALDGQLAAASVTPEQLHNANEPAFQAAADVHQSAKTEAGALPAKARTQEAQLLTNTQADMVATTSGGLTQMSQGRADKLNASAEKQAAAKVKYEQTRARISKQLSDVYATTEKAVNDRMAKIDKDVADAFDQGATIAKVRFYAFLGTRLLIYYASGTWLVEAITGGNSKEKIFKQAQDDFEADMLSVIDKVADIVETGLNEVINLIASGRASLETELARLDPADRDIGSEVASEFRKQFAQLEKSVEEKQTQIIESVAQKYREAQKAVESTIAILRNPVAALIDLAKEQIAGVIETILNLKNMLFGLLAKASAAIDLIIKDPIAFLGNLVAGVKLGLMNFVGKIGMYLQKGLLEWLFGALAGAGIQLPDKFDLSGLFSVVLQVLGLTWTNIRARAVKAVGENTVKVLETGSQIIMTLVTKGVSGLWEYIKEQAVTLIETVKEGIKSFVMESIVVAGVKWLIGLLNPASAFVKACMAIYDIVMFIVNRGQQIMAFVNAVLDSVLSIAQGAIGVAATAVENALARALPVAIGFLASLLGLGDLSGKIKKVIDKIQEPVNRVIDWVIEKAVSIVKKIGKAIGFGGKTEKREQGPLPDLHENSPAEMQNTRHSLSIAIEKGQVRFTMKSTEVFLEVAISEAIENVAKRNVTTPAQKKDQVVTIGMLRELQKLVDRNAILQDYENQHDPAARATTQKKYFNQRLAQIAGILKHLGTQGGVDELRDFAKSISSKRTLPKSFDIRAKLYTAAAGYRDAMQFVRDRDFPRLIQEIILARTSPDAWAKLKAAQKIPSTATVNSDPHRIVTASNYDVNHEPALVDHWNDVGRSTGDQPRHLKAVDTNPTNLHAMPKEYNRAKDSGKRYERDVTESFASALVSPDGREIDGKPMDVNVS